MVIVCDAGEKYFALHWLVVLWLTGWVVNRECGVAGCDVGEKCFAPTLAVGGADQPGFEQGMRW